MILIALAACSNDAPKPAPTPASTTAAPEAKASTTAAPATPSTLANPPAAATATAVSDPTPPSPEPSLQDWEAAKRDLGVIKNWDTTGCVARRLREWVRVGCSDSSKNGAPTRIEIVKGFPKAKFNNLEGRGGSIMLVFPAKPGLDGEATFVFADATFRFAVSWPAGAPEPKPLASLEAVASPEPESGSAPSSPTASADLLPEEPVVEGAPKAEEWAAAREVGVKGSGALGCETKQIGDWFRMVCRANDRHGKATSAVAVHGFDAKRGYVITGNGAVILLTQFVKGTDTAIDISWERTSARLTLVWPDSIPTIPSIRGELVTSQKAP